MRRLIPAARALQLSAHEYDEGGAKSPRAWNDPADINRVVTELTHDATTVLGAMADLDLNAVHSEAVGRLGSVSG